MAEIPTDRYCPHAEGYKPVLKYFDGDEPVDFQGREAEQVESNLETAFWVVFAALIMLGILAAAYLAGGISITRVQ